MELVSSKDLRSETLNTRRRLPDSYSLSDTNVKMMKQWIYNCATHHQQCQHLNTTTPWVPRRLIEILEQDGSLSLRLIETTEIPAATQYAALSHMWGDITTSPPLRTNMSNYQAMVVDIKWDHLPRNFFEAILVCNKLDINHLWIDSFCIIQDNPDDWARESVTMHYVYRHALCTIVA